MPGARHTTGEDFKNVEERVNQIKADLDALLDDAVTGPRIAYGLRCDTVQMAREILEGRVRQVYYDHEHGKSVRSALEDLESGYAKARRDAR